MSNVDCSPKKVDFTLNLEQLSFIDLESFTFLYTRFPTNNLLLGTEVFVLMSYLDFSQVTLWVCPDTHPLDWPHACEKESRLE